MRDEGEFFTSVLKGETSARGTCVCKGPVVRGGGDAPG